MVYFRPNYCVESLYGGPQLSHQIQITHIKYKIAHIKYKLLTSNTNYSHQIQNCSHQIQIAHIKYKLLTSNTKLLTSNTNCSHQIQITHVKYKLLTSTTNCSINTKIKRSAVGERKTISIFHSALTRPPFCSCTWYHCCNYR